MKSGLDIPFPRTNTLHSPLSNLRIALPAGLPAFVVVSIVLHLVLLAYLLNQPGNSRPLATANSVGQSIQIRLASTGPDSAATGNQKQNARPGKTDPGRSTPPREDARLVNSPEPGKPAIQARYTVANTPLSKPEPIAITAMPDLQTIPRSAASRSEPAAAAQPQVEIQISARDNRPVLTAQQKANLGNEVKSARHEASTTRPAATATGHHASAQSSAAAATIAQPADSQATIERYQDAMLAQVQSRLSGHLFYPTQARRRGWQGEVLVGFMIDARGQLGNIHLAHSSGFSLLDKTALNAMRKVGRIPFSGYNPADNFDLILPGRFQLRDS